MVEKERTLQGEGVPHMKSRKVAQQVLDPGGIGGVSSEYKALRNAALQDQYTFHPVVLEHWHAGINLRDILFYYRAFRAVQPDIIHVRGAAADGLNAEIAAKLAGCGRLLVTVHGMYSDLVYYAPIKRWICRNLIERMCFSLADGISCVYEGAGARACFAPYRKKMLPPVYNRMPKYAADGGEARNRLRRELGIPETAAVGVYTGRITREKGMEDLLNALLQTDSDWPAGLWLILVGDGDYRKAMEEKLSRMEHRERIVFTGYRPQVEAYLKAADFFVHPSLHENLSISILEACAARLPCIVTDVGGNREIIREDFGMILPAHDPAALRRAMLRMCDDRCRQRLREALEQESFAQFQDEQVDQQLRQVYEKLLCVEGEKA